MIGAFINYERLGQLHETAVEGYTPHTLRFRSIVSVCKRIFTSKKSAKQDVAKLALEHLLTDDEAASTNLCVNLRKLYKSSTTYGGSLAEMVDSHTNGYNLYVSSILHKAPIDVDEQRTEAAAISVAIFKPLCRMRKPDFVTDHPFLFTVREDKSGSILFMGQVLDPSKH